MTMLTPALAAVLVRYLEHLRHRGMTLPEFANVVPVPMHPRRVLERGENHAALLAGELCQRMGWRFTPEVLVRRRFTAPQVRRNARQRQRNVSGAFAVAPAAVLHGRSVLVVDDVVTSGNTLRECAATLKRAGAESVTALALAHG